VVQELNTTFEILSPGYRLEPTAILLLRGPLQTHIIGIKTRVFVPEIFVQLVAVASSLLAELHSELRFADNG
jgi:hypothetical protein